MTFPSWSFESLSVFVFFSSGFTLFRGLRGVKKDLHCNPFKLVVSGNKLFVPGGRKWDSLRDAVSKGWRGISHCVLLRKDMILSSPSLGWLSWQPEKARAYPTEPTAQLQQSLFRCVPEEMDSDETLWLAPGPLFLGSWRARDPGWIQELSFFICQTAGSVFKKKKTKRDYSSAWAWHSTAQHAWQLLRIANR